VRIVVTSPKAAEAFAIALGRIGVEVVKAPLVKFERANLEPQEIFDALRKSTHAVFATGESAYKLAEILGDSAELRELLSKLVVATPEGRKGAVMIENKFGIKAQIVSTSSEELLKRIEECDGVVVFHYGEYDGEFVGAIGEKCGEVHNFSPYRALPEDIEKYVLLLSPGGDVYVFFSSLSVKYAVENPYGLPIRERLASSINVAAGPAVAKALAKYGLPRLMSPSGRIGDVINFVLSLMP